MKRSAGILIYKRDPLRVLLGHPGGPFFAKKDEGAWSISKGLIGEDEDPLTAACRECKEETGITATGPFLELGEAALRSGKRVLAWGSEATNDIPELLGASPSVFELEWPPRSGKYEIFPEFDRASFFQADTALEKVNPAQRIFIERLRQTLGR